MMIQSLWRDRKRLWWETAYFIDIIATIAVFLLTRKLFYNQIAFQSNYVSDLAAQVDTAINGGEIYSITAIFMNLSYRIRGYAGIVAFLGLIVALTMWANAWFVKRLLEQKSSDCKWDLSLIFLIAASAIFLSSIYIPRFYSVFYNSGDGCYTDFTQPYHGATYLVMRFFSVLTLMMYFKIEKDYLKKISLKDLAIFFVLLVLVNAAKPNFFIAFAPAMLCFLIYDFIRTQAKGFLQIVKFGLPVLFSASVLLFQSSVLYNSDSAAPSGIEVSFRQFKQVLDSHTFWGYLIAGASFVILVSALCIIHKQFTRQLAFGWLTYGFSFVQRWFFFETGPRAEHGNFSWGAKCTSFLLTLVCLERLIYLYKSKKLSMTTLLAAVSLYGLMVISGLAYFMLLYNGVSFLI